MRVIQDGRVTLNGVLNKEPSTPVDPRKDKVTVDGRKVEVKGFEYIMLHKPAGFVTTKEDAHAERTVMDLLPDNLKHLVPVGRLDKDTEGLLLLTNDGDLTFRMTHPQFTVDKKYLVRIGGQLVAEKKNKLQEGVVIEGRKTAPAQILDVKEFDGQTEFFFVIHEGRKRQVRLMMKAVGCAVRYLRRTAQGPLELGNLALGKWRTLSPSEIALIKRPSIRNSVKPQASKATTRLDANAPLSRKVIRPSYSAKPYYRKRDPRSERRKQGQ